MRRNEETFARRVQRCALPMGTELLFRKLSRPLFCPRQRKARFARQIAVVKSNCRAACLLAARPGAPRFSIAKHHYPKRAGLSYRFPGTAARPSAVRSRFVGLRSVYRSYGSRAYSVDRVLSRAADRERSDA